MVFFRMYSHAWRRTLQQIVLWKKGEQTVKQPVAVADVAKGITNAMLDRSTSGKIYQAVGYVSCDYLKKFSVKFNFFFFF